MRFQILCLDGGGIRGLFSSAILAAIEDDINTNVVDHFDLIAGTSTGGIIAIALGLGLKPREIVDFYRSFGPKIFADPLLTKTISHWFVRKHSAGVLKNSLRSTFKERKDDTSRDRLFGESSKRLIIPSFDIGNDDVHHFRTPHLERLKRDYKVPAWKVALATAAAPTYFPACREVDGLRLIDGGVFANNPALVAITEAAQLGVDFSDIRLLSIGTCDPLSSRPKFLNWSGKLGWAPYAADIFMRSNTVNTNNQVRHILGENFVRIDPQVPSREVSLDDISDTESLIARAAHYSRLMMPTVAKVFAEHSAPSYAPLHTIGVDSNEARKE